MSSLPPGSTPVDGVEVLGALSPSRAADFVRCPLAFRFRTIDRLPEPPSPAAVRGTVVHRVLEHVFDLPAPRRVPREAHALVAPAWAAVLEAEPELAAMFGSGTEADTDLEAWLASCHEVLERWFTLEDPTRLEPAEREVYVEALLESRLLLRGFVDRVDLAPDGAVRITDYKTGGAPREGFEASALFQLKFYALVWWHLHGVLPTVLQLVYLGSGEIIRYEPDEQDLAFTRRKVEAIWAAVVEARTTRTWVPNRGRACYWCAHRALCPAWGGTPPPLPEPAEASGTDRGEATGQASVRA